MAPIQVPTTIGYHQLILDTEDFKAGNVDTGFIPSHAEELAEPPTTGKLVRVIFQRRVWLPDADRSAVDSGQGQGQGQGPRAGQFARILQHIDIPAQAQELVMRLVDALCRTLCPDRPLCSIGPHMDVLAG